MSTFNARRFALGLLQLAKSPEEMEKVEADLGAFHEVLAAIPHLGRILTNPGVPEEKRAALLDDVSSRLGASNVSIDGYGLVRRQNV